MSSEYIEITPNWSKSGSLKWLQNEIGGIRLSFPGWYIDEKGALLLRQIAENEYEVLCWDVDPRLALEKLVELPMISNFAMSSKEEESQLENYEIVRAALLEEMYPVNELKESLA